MSARISVPPDLEAAFGEAVQAAIKDLKRQGYSKAYICERSFEIEDAALDQVLKQAGRSSNGEAPQTHAALLCYIRNGCRLQ